MNDPCVNMQENIEDLAKNDYKMDLSEEELPSAFTMDLNHDKSSTVDCDDSKNTKRLVDPDITVTDSNMDSNTANTNLTEKTILPSHKGTLPNDENLPHINGLPSVNQNVDCDVVEPEKQLDQQEDFMDILGNGHLTKRILKPGLGRESRPNHGDMVVIGYTACLEDGSTVDAKDNFSFILGDGDVIHALDLALALTERQEEFLLKTTARFAYGSKGNLPTIPPDATLHYTVKLISSDDPPDYSKMTPLQRIEAASKKRERGNELYRREEFGFATNSYSKAINILDKGQLYKADADQLGDNTGGDCSQEDGMAMLIKLKNNLAAAQLKIEAYDVAIESCNFVLNSEPNNVKALFRKGKALLGKREYRDAMEVLKVAAIVDPDSKITAAELAKCKQLWREECEQRKRVYKKMFNGSSQNSMNKSRSAYISPWIKFRGYIGATLAVSVSIGIVVLAKVYGGK